MFLKYCPKSVYAVFSKGGMNSNQFFCVLPFYEEEFRRQRVLVSLIAGEPLYLNEKNVN